MKKWRTSQQGPRVEGSPARRLRARMTALATVLVVLMVGLGALLLHSRPPPNASFVGVWITEYVDPRLPVNAWAAEDRDALLGIGWRAHDRFSFQEQKLLERDLKQAIARAPNPLVVYVCAHALTGKDGRVYL